MRINAWEAAGRSTPIATATPSKLSRVVLERLAEAEAMTLDDYRADLKTREAASARSMRRSRANATSASRLSATGAAPVGLHSTGDPIFAVPCSLLGIPAISLPVLQDEGLPLGLQVIGFEHGDAALFAAAGASSVR